MVEFALVVPILTGLFLAAMFFGNDFLTYNRLEEAVRAGARFASIQTYDAYHTAKDPAPPTCASCQFPLTSGPFLRKIRNIVAYGCDPVTEAESGCTATLVVDGVRPENVNVTFSIVNWVPRSVSVSMSGVTLPMPAGSVTLRDKPVTTFPYFGKYMAPLPPK